jgi:hypothetical protein
MRLALECAGSESFLAGPGLEGELTDIVGVPGNSNNGALAGGGGLDLDVCAAFFRRLWFIPSRVPATEPLKLEVSSKSRTVYDRTEWESPGWYDVAGL